MADVRFKEGSMEWLMFRDYWRMCQKFWIPEDNADYWDSVIREASDFYKRYGDEIFARGLALAFIETLDKKIRLSNADSRQGAGEVGEYPFRVCGFAKKYPFLGEAILNLIEDLAGGREGVERDEAKGIL